MEWTSFVLKVTDSSGTSATDTVFVKVCSHGPVPLGEIPVIPTVGGTVTFTVWTTFMCGIDSVAWEPAPNIISPLDQFSIEVIIDDTNFHRDQLHVALYSEHGCEIESMISPFVIEAWPTGVLEHHTQTWNAWPNPTSGTFTIVAGFDIRTIEIMDVKGRKVYSTATNSSTATMDINLPNGLYLLKATSETNEVFRKKLVVQR